MYLRANSFGRGSSLHGDYRLATAGGLVLAAYAAFFLALYWLMQPSVTANPGLAAYRPPPKTVVRYADSPWVPPDPSETFPIRAAATEPASPVAKSSVTEEPKKETKKQEPRPTARRAPPVREQPNQFWGQNSFWGQASSRPSGSRPWF